MMHTVITPLLWLLVGARCHKAGMSFFQTTCVCLLATVVMFAIVETLK